MMRTDWWEGALVGLDLETTSPDPNVARIVTCTLVLDTPGQTPEALEWLVNPGVEIPAEAIAVHGVTNEIVQSGGIPTPEAIMEILTAMLDISRLPLVVFNAAYDLTVLDREMRRHRGHPFTGPNGWPWSVADPFVLDKQLATYRPGSRKLQDVAKVYGVELVDAHNSTADALAAIGIVRAMGRVAGFPDPGELHAREVVWREKQVDSLESYFVRTMQFDGKPLAREWPVVPGEPT